jgi:hypothetical protein
MAQQYPNLLTNGTRTSQVLQTYYSPVAIVPPSNIPLATIYCFLGQVDPWVDDANPPVPTQTQKNLKQIFKNMFVIKKINTNNISPVIRRVDWTANRVYDYYRDDVEMFGLDLNNNLVKTFYVKNRYDQIFKCLWNNNDLPSTLEPYFEPGTYGSNGIYEGADGYKWKFMYTIDSGSKINFLDTTWIPVPLGASSFTGTTNTIGAGDVEVINIINGGSGYDPANAAISVVVTGDGIDAKATAIVSGGKVTDIAVTNPGSGYTYADVTITSTLGSGAVASAPISPPGGHGYDPVPELGCTNVMFTCEFDGSEGGYIPTDITYHQLGMLVNPAALDNPLGIAGYPIYDLSTNVNVAPGFGVFNLDEIVYQGDIANPTFTATILDFDPASNVVKLINISGSAITNAPIFGKSSKTARTLLIYNEPNFVPFSGYISYIENRSGIQRSADGIEQFKFVLGY